MAHSIPGQPKSLRLRGHGLALLAWTALVLCLASGASAQNLVFHSPNDDGVMPPDAPALAIGPNESLFLYLDTGAAISSTGTTACNDGDGREICGYSFRIDALGGASFADLNAEPNVVFSATTSSININGSFALAPAQGPARIGEVLVSSSEEGSAVFVVTGEVVLAALQVEPIVQSILGVTAVPEPGLAISLVCGASALSWLSSRRRRRRD